jgi:Flp pilus assembly protein TadG
MLTTIATSLHALGKRLTPRMFRRLVRNADGISAIEFALVGPAFIALLVAILETGMVFFFQQLLQSATTQAARLIMTGQAQTQKLSSAQFLQDVCDDAGSLFNCANLSANVQTFTSFGGMTQSNPISSGTFSAPATFTPGGPGDIVLVQVFYELPVTPAPLGFNVSNTSNGNAILVGTAVFRNEPYH